MAVALIIATYPGDEVFSCGGTIANHAGKGDDVHIFTIHGKAPGESSSGREKDLSACVKVAHGLLGVTSPASMDYWRLPGSTHEEGRITDALAEVVRRVTPETIYLNYPLASTESGPDETRAKVYAAILDACLPVLSGPFRLLAYEALWPAVPSLEFEVSFTPTVFSDITSHMERKLKSIEHCAKCGSGNVSDLLTYFRERAARRGVQVGVRYSEAFVLVREKWA